MSFPSLQNHVVFVSRQTLPTVLAASIPGAQPACIHALVTPEMKKYGSILRDALESCGYKYREYTLPDTSQQTIFARLEAIRHACGNEPLGVNLTGGTKLMALAAADWARACAVPAFYIDTAADKIVLPGARQWEYADLPDVMDVKRLLAANGYKVESLKESAVPAERRKAIAGMVEMLRKDSNNAVEEAEAAFRSLNACAHDASCSEYMGVRENGSRQSPAWNRLLALCQQAGMLQRAKGRISFPSEDARQWCNGRWLEEFVQMVLYRLKCDGRIRSWASSVCVLNNAISNELDALFCVRNRLFMLECKTSVMNAPVIYKADSLHDRLGGVFTKAMLCSIFKLAPLEQKRADELGIRVVSGAELRDLGNLLARWSARA